MVAIFNGFGMLPYEQFIGTTITSVHQKAHSALGENPLLHGETLLVTTSHDLENISFELITKVVTNNLLSQPLVIELAAAETTNTHIEM